MSYVSHIQLTDDPKVQAMLGRKAEEYEGRIIGKTATVRNALDFYKFHLMTRLIETGDLYLIDLMSAYTETDWFNPTELVHAFKIVHAYNINCPQMLFGGTGLK